MSVAGLIARALILARVRLAGSGRLVDRLTAPNDALRSELARVTAERQLLRERLEKIPARRRPFFSPFARLEILWHLHRYNLSFAEAASLFLVTQATISNWVGDTKRGVRHLLRARHPLNKLPDVVASPGPSRASA
jgi:hypothetical protein